MQKDVARITPLVEQLQWLFRSHEEGDRGAAAEEMLTCLRGIWPDVREVVLDREREDSRDADQMVLEIIRDVGEIAAFLLGVGPDKGLAWSRANLIVDLERYSMVIHGQ